MNFAFETDWKVIIFKFSMLKTEISYKKNFVNLDKGLKTLEIIIIKKMLTKGLATKMTGLGVSYSEIIRMENCLLPVLYHSVTKMSVQARGNHGIFPTR